MTGLDGPITSAGMDRLAERIPGAEVFNWTDLFSLVMPKLRSIPLTTKVAVIGYSGGASRGSWLGYYTTRPVDLLIGYDPSPALEVWPLRRVHKAICYHNQHHPWPLGGGRYIAAAGQAVEISTYDVTEEHLAVQWNESLHKLTLEAYKSLAAA